MRTFGPSVTSDSPGLPTSRCSVAAAPEAPPRAVGPYPRFWRPGRRGLRRTPRASAFRSHRAQSPPQATGPPAPHSPLRLRAPPSQQIPRRDADGASGPIVLRRNGAGGGWVTTWVDPVEGVGEVGRGAPGPLGPGGGRMGNLGRLGLEGQRNAAS